MHSHLILASLSSLPTREISPASIYELEMPARYLMIWQLSFFSGRENAIARSIDIPVLPSVVAMAATRRPSIKSGVLVDSLLQICSK